MAAADDSVAARVLVVAHRTAATPRLIEAIRARARAGPCTFTLLVPRGYWDPDTEASSLVLELALPLLEDAAGAPHHRSRRRQRPVARRPRGPRRWRLPRGHHLHAACARVALAPARLAEPSREARPAGHRRHRAGAAGIGEPTDRLALSAVDAQRRGPMCGRAAEHECKRPDLGLRLRVIATLPLVAQRSTRRATCMARYRSCITRHGASGVCAGILVRSATRLAGDRSLSSCAGAHWRAHRLSAPPEYSPPRAG